MSVAESFRSSRLLAAGHRMRHDVAHGSLRWILGQYLEISASHVEIEIASGGKPWLVDGQDLHFSMSYTHDLSAVVVCRNRRVGIDIEDLSRGGRRMPLLTTYLSASERSGVAQLPPSERKRGLMTCWVRKEAYVKATGCGLSFPLDQIPTETVGNAVVPVRLATGSDLRAWHFYPLELGNRYVGAVVADGQPFDLSYFWTGFDPILPGSDGG